jgi:anti-anti-sigma regulatory factor
MTPSTGKLLVWAGDAGGCVRVVGRANFALSVDFRKLLRHLQSAGHARLLLDLSECQIMDSTFLGVLAFEANQLATRAEPAGAARVELLNVKPSVRETITDLGIARLFQFLERDLGAEEFKAAPVSATASPEEFARTSLEAHELLMALHPANVAKFKEVARFLAEELKQNVGSGDATASRPW